MILPLLKKRLFARNKKDKNDMFTKLRGVIFENFDHFCVLSFLVTLNITFCALYVHIKFTF